jgi:glyoxylase-like metal-dependent hydrolase (beta-lactamase superfamily II)
MCQDAAIDILRWQVGAATIVRIAETDASAAVDGLYGELDRERLLRDAGWWLTPRFMDSRGHLRGLVQGFLVRTDGVMIVVDPGVGNGKQRTVVPEWNDMHTPFLDQIRTVGADPDRVDYVINTHLHFDHVGWNTEYRDGAWRPTFPAARYLISADEFAYWRGQPEAEIADQHAGFADSVLPVYAAGLVDLVADDHQLTDSVRLVPSPGHTPHHVSVVISSAGRTAVITGDVMHHPCQIAYPDWGALSDFDPDQARASRTDLVERYADSDALVIGTHFADPVAGFIREQGGARYLAAASSA